MSSTFAVVAAGLGDTTTDGRDATAVKLEAEDADWSATQSLC